MTAKFASRVKREVSFAGKPYTLTIEPNASQLIPRQQAEGTASQTPGASECFLIGYDRDEAKLDS